MDKQELEARSEEQMQVSSSIEQNLSDRLSGLPEQLEWGPMLPEAPLVRQQRKRHKAFLAGIVAGELLILAGLLNLTGGVVMVLPAFVIALLVSLRAKAAIFRLPTASDMKVLSDPDRQDEVLAQIWVEVEGVVHGADRGVVWFDENGFHFLGHRSWFRISKRDFLRETESWRRTRLAELDAFPGIISLQVRGRAPRVRIGIRPILAAGLISEEARLNKCVEAFMISKDRSSMPTQLPPLGLDPAFRRVGLPIMKRWELAMTSLGIVAFWLFTLAAGYGEAVRDTLFIGLIGIAFPVWRLSLSLPGWFRRRRQRREATLGVGNASRQSVEGLQ